jgi:hypothetical protein
MSTQISAPAGVDHRRHRQVVEVRILVNRLLVAVGVDLLLEVSLAIQQADADKRQAQVAGGLAVVAGQDAQTAGVDRQALVKPEFGAKIGDQIVLAEHRRIVVAPVVGQVGVVGRQHALVAVKKSRI